MLLSLVKCGSCGSHFNGKSGRSVKNAIKVYTLTTLLVLVVLMALLMYQVAGTSKKESGHGSQNGIRAQAECFVISAA
jgi:peptidyl-tRNA hydrolase